LTDSSVRVYTGEALAAYHFGAAHPFGPERYPSFLARFQDTGIAAEVQRGEPVNANPDQVAAFHDPDYIGFVRTACEAGQGALDHGDTPALPGLYEASLCVAGTVLAAVDAIMDGQCNRAFVPIAGLHHARRDAAAGFCVFNDCGVAIEHLRKHHEIRRILYVDIDAHHGDGVYYGFERDPDLFVLDFHEDGAYLYPGTGAVTDNGTGAAAGTKLNVPLPPGADDAVFFKAWELAQSFIERAEPEFVILQCGADSIDGDPLTHLAFTTAVHYRVARALAELADRKAQGRLLALGGGGYDLNNIANGWCEVIRALVNAGQTARQPV
jgi:acetoin utilization protein AcuC